MRDARRLSLRRETLTVLTSDEMSGVAGGSHLCTVTHGASFDVACPIPTTPINECVNEVTQRTCITISPDVCIWT